MSVSWTKEQQRVIDLQKCNILVSAAAGSGKTAVLVERIITMLTRKEAPVDVDKLLIVTFTEAAAAEMKKRIRSAIEKKLMQYPEDVHLQQQATLIHNAKITTIHSFCLSVIRDHFHTVDLDPGFRIGEEGELKLLRHDVIKEVLEETYEEGKESFWNFVEVYAGKKDDKKIEELVLKLYEFSRSYPDAKRWLQSCVEFYGATSEEALEESMYMDTVRKNSRQYARDAKELLAQGLELCQDEDGPYMYEKTLLQEMDQIESFEEARTYREYYKSASEFVWNKIAANRDKSVCVEKASLVKAHRDQAKSIMKDLTSWYFVQSLEELMSDMEQCYPMIQVLVQLVENFGQRFEEKKQTQNVIDFDDMEQYALKILTDHSEAGLIPSKVAREYQGMFEEVMIDEYQDSNLIQEAILTSVSRVSGGEYNVFMVGDVKQSIYRFRLSRPELFMEKFYSYNTKEGECQRIDLSRNFRSREEVLSGINYLFEQLMTKELGGIIYGEDAALYKGSKFQESSKCHTEIIMIDPEQEETESAKEEEISGDREMEARAIAARIKELLMNHEVVDKKTETLRPVAYSDIVILTRSIKGFTDVFAQVLNREGIPTHTGTKEGYFETREIGVLLDYLRVLNNRRQDLPLAAVLSSSFGKLSDNELAEIKSAYPKSPFYQAVIAYEKEGREAVVRGKVQQCLTVMDQFRDMIPYTGIHELLQEILTRTGYLDYISALPGGEQRRANVEMLVEKAVAFGTTSYKGLFNFVRYIEQLQKYDVDYGEASISDEQSDTVRIMSIHKSKGLEFPIVIVAGMGKRFNQQDARESVVLHAKLGVGLDAVDLEMRTKAPSFFKKVIQREEVLESLGEELRVLYVALTRAKEKLIITGILKKPFEKLEAYQGLEASKRKALSFAMLSKASSYWDWLLPALIRLPEDIPIEYYRCGLEELLSAEIVEVRKNQYTRQALVCWDVEATYNEEMEEHVKQQFSFTYPFSQVEEFQLKFTVSELKKRIYQEDEDGEMMFAEPEETIVPKFRKEERALTGASRGSAYHRVMELLDNTKPYDAEALKKQLEAWVERGTLSQEEMNCINIEDVLLFLQSSTGEKMKEAALRGTLWKEQPFVLGVDMQRIYKEAKGEEVILVQGIIDAYFEEEDGIVVLDYKTDQVKDGKVLREKYREQLEYYGEAIEQITGKAVKEWIIYSFTLQQEIVEKKGVL